MEERINLLTGRLNEKIQLYQTNKNIPIVQGKINKLNKTPLDFHFLLKI
jgi:hypothetical protein